MRQPDCAKGKAADASHSKPAAFQDFAANTNVVSVECATAPDSLEALRRGLAAVGMSCFQLHGSELAVTGPGCLPKALPDVRSGWVYLRQLRRFG